MNNIPRDYYTFATTAKTEEGKLEEARQFIENVFEVCGFKGKTKIKTSDYKIVLKGNKAKLYLDI